MERRKKQETVVCVWLKSCCYHFVAILQNANNTRTVNTENTCTDILLFSAENHAPNDMAFQCKI